MNWFANREIRRTATYAVLALAVLAWFAIVARLTYDFANPAANAMVRENTSFVGAILVHAPRNIALWFLGSLFIVSAIGPGAIIFRLLRMPPLPAAEWIAFSIGLGLIAETFVTLAIGALKLLWPTDIYGMVILAVIATIYEIVRRTRLPSVAGAIRENWPVWKKCVVAILVLAILVNLFLALLGALMPEVQFDARWYHLAQAKRYAEHHAFFNAVRMLGMASLGLPHYQEILYTAVTTLWGIGAAKVLSWWNAALTATFIIIFCRRFWQSTIMGLLAALLFVNSPLIDWSASTAGNDLALAPLTLLSFYAALMWERQRQVWQWLAVAGALCGFALGIKPFAVLTFAILLVAIVALEWNTDRNASLGASERPRWYSASIFCGAALLCFLPDLITATVMTGNPIFPFANGIFQSPYWTAVMAQTVAQSYSARGADTSSMGALLAFPWNSLASSDAYQNLPGPLFLFGLPIVLVTVFIRRRTDNALMITALYLFAWLTFWFATGAVEIRYTEAVWPLTSIVYADCLLLKPITAPLQKLLQGILIAITAIILILNCQLLIPWQRHALLEFVEGRETINWHYLYENLPEREVQLQYAPMLEYINGHLDPSRDKVYDAADGIIFNVYSNVDLFNGSQYDGPTGGGQWSLSSADAYSRLKDLNIDYVMVFDSGLGRLKTLPIWQHLQLVQRTPPSALYGGKRGYGEALLRLKP